MTNSHRNKHFESLYLNGQISLELIPQGTLVGRLHAHAAGFPAFFTPTGASTAVEEGSIPIRLKEGGIKAGVAVPGNKKEAREFNGRRFVMEPAIVGDVAIIRAWKVDEVGNCVFRYAANNFSATMARNAKLTIVEVRVPPSRSVVVSARTECTAGLHRRRTSCPLGRCRRTRFTCPGFTSTAS